MYIIDKNKDFYDHFSYIYGVDKSVVFDRRGSKQLTDLDLTTISTGWSKHKWYLHEKGAYLLLEVGNVQHLIKLFDVVYTRTDINYNVTDFKVELVNTFRENKNHFNSPLSIRECSVLCGYYKDKFQEVKLKEDTKFDDVITILRDNKAVNLPILKDCKLTSIIDPDELWKELQNYLSALNSEVKVDNRTNIEKVESHGFDKTTSFRGIVK